MSKPGIMASICAASAIAVVMADYFGLPTGVSHGSIIALGQQEGFSQTDPHGVELKRPFFPTPNVSLHPLDYVPSQDTRDKIAPIINKRLIVNEGSTLTELLTAQGVSTDEAQQAISALRAYFDPRNLKIGDTIEVALRSVEETKAQELIRLSLRPSLEHQLIINRDNDGLFKAQKTMLVLDHTPKRIHGKIATSFYVDASKSGVPVSVINEVTRALSYEIHMQRDIQPDTPFEILYENTHDPQGHNDRPGQLLYAALKVNGAPVRIYRYTDMNGHTDLYNDKGASVRKALLMTPIAAARLSSPFGQRKHPIFGFSRLHRGVDFAAAPGTPVMSAGAGTIFYAGRKGGYGNYIKVNHDNGYQTVYAHLRNFAKNIHKGTRVKQGQVIGFVGNTGTSTGYHLHHEVIFGGKHINPQAIKQSAKVKLIGQELRRFQAFKKKIDSQLVGFEGKTQIAFAEATAEGSS